MIIETLGLLGIATAFFSEDKPATDNGLGAIETPNPSLDPSALYGIPCMNERTARKLYGEPGQPLEGLGGTDEKGEKIRDVYQIVTNLILEKIESSDSLPWRKPWSQVVYTLEAGKTVSSGAHQNFGTRRRYSGVNVLLLTMADRSIPYWMTFNQIDKKGGRVKEGAESEKVIYYTLIAKDPEGKRITVDEYNRAQEEGLKDYKMYPILKYYRVFNIEDVTGIDFGIVATPATDYQPVALQTANDIVTYMPKRPPVNHGGQAWWKPGKDVVNMPYYDQFEEPQKYYSILFHELAHSTMDPKRLNDPERGGKKFGDPKYTEEELVAEFTAQYLSAEAGIFFHTRDNSAAYVKGWKRSIRQSMEEDNRWIFRTMSKAQKAADYILDNRKKKKAYTPKLSTGKLLEAEQKPKEKEPAPKPTKTVSKPVRNGSKKGKTAPDLNRKRSKPTKPVSKPPKPLTPEERTYQEKKKKFDKAVEAGRFSQDKADRVLKPYREKAEASKKQLSLFGTQKRKP
ncbi:hypothetical protein FUAX_09740 [Fulvitalea axinellae]|uniref:DUF1738 domain-containing protein n=1 Tax=Fulvitalea axinellae TaxID=1182444 RepID=A0AAU9CT22_9BACT|nr:hypothetical protein FUAX_09740 [Fulvitalea axinellae]